MYSLEDALDSFNRKERNLLVRAILRQEGPLRLSERFRNQVAKQLGLQSIPEDAWWATDYHISWLAGALALFVKGKERARDPWENLEKKDHRQLVEGHQQDFDLVIMTGCELILIEVKAYSPWDKDQLASKLARLDLLREFYRELVGTEPAEHAVSFHLLLISPDPPPVELTACCPSWARKGQKVPWIKLPTKPVLKVTRCNPAGKKDATGGHWHIEGIGRSG